MKLTLAILFAALGANAATYYVATTGSDSADGSLATPWLTIGKATASVAPGDTVTVKAGTYREFVTNTVSGTAGNLITFQGERAGSSWLTIIDPSSDYSAGWVAAPEIGTGVYKQTGMPWETREMTIGGKRVAFVSALGDMASLISTAYPTCGFTAGSNFLTLASSAVLKNYRNEDVTWWNTVQALYCASGTTTYLRLRDGSNPNGLAIRCAPNIDGSRSKYVEGYAAVDLNSIAYTVWKNFNVRGAFCGFNLRGTANNNVIQSNLVQNGCMRVNVYSGPYANTLIGNELTCNYYGYSAQGAWEGLSSFSVDKANCYYLSKYLMGEGETFDSDMQIIYAGNSNVISGNLLHNSLGQGVNIDNNLASPITTGTVISGNTLYAHPSTGITLSIGETGTRIYDNLIYDCNANIRVMYYNNTPAETDRVLYIYRNRFYLSSIYGTHLFVFLSTLPDPPTYAPEIWWYHNSVSGGWLAADLGNPVFVPGLRVVNNVISSVQYFYGGTHVLTNATAMGAWDYTLQANASVDLPRPAWWGSSNVVQATPVWTTPIPSFVLPTGSAAINSALDITQPFTLNGTSYPALPTNGITKIGSAWDMGALEQAPTPVISRLRVTHMKGKP